MSKNRYNHQVSVTEQMACDPLEFKHRYNADFHNIIVRHILQHSKIQTTLEWIVSSEDVFQTCKNKSRYKKCIFKQPTSSDCEKPYSWYHRWWLKIRFVKILCCHGHNLTGVFDILSISISDVLHWRRLVGFSFLHVLLTININDKK